jgi:hypothetical protein
MSTLERKFMINRIRSFAILLLIVCLLPSGPALAQTPAQDQDPAALAKRPPLNGVRIQNSSLDETIPPAELNTNYLPDPSFEATYAGTANSWGSSSTNFGTVFCSVADCGNGGGTAVPRSGTAWAWFGGVNFTNPLAINPEVGIVYNQPAFVFPGCSTLQFYFWIGSAPAGSDANDYFRATIDGTPVFQANATQTTSYPAYTLVTVNVSSFSNSPHQVIFDSQISGQTVTFNLDDVALLSTCYISGNVGVGGVTLSYTDGTPKSVISKGDGSYSLPVSYGWSGTVTASHPCYTFSQPNRNYNNVTAYLSAQNYNTPTFTPTPACKVTAGVFRPGNGVIYLKNTNTAGFADINLNYGIPGDYPITGDWDGDGDDTIGIYRNGVFYLRNSNTIGVADIQFAFGQPGDQPVAGDWDNDGDTTIGVFHNGTFLLRNSNSPGLADIQFNLGIPGDVGIAGDWDGNGSVTTGVFRPGNGVIFLKNTNASGFADVALNYGNPGDKPVTGDWDGDGDDTIGIYRNGTFYLRNSNTIGVADIQFSLGNPGDMPIAGNWDGMP